MKKVISIVALLMSFAFVVHAADWSNPNPQAGGDKAGELLLKHEDNFTEDLYKADTGKLNLLKKNFAGTSAPTSPSQGQAWWDTTNRVLKIYNGTNWPSGKIYNAVNADKAKNVTNPGSSPPSSPSIGDFWYNTTTQITEIYNGTDWTTAKIYNSVSADSADSAKALTVWPTFSVTKSANQTIPTGTNTKVTWDTEEWDDNNNFSSSKFTPPAGKYLLIASTEWSLSGFYYRIFIYKNGAVYKQIENNSGSSGETGENLPVIVSANGTDYFEVYAWQNSGSNKNIAFGYATFFQGSRIR